MADSPGWQSLNEDNPPPVPDRPRGAALKPSAPRRRLPWAVLAFVVVAVYGLYTLSDQADRIRRLEEEKAALGRAPAPPPSAEKSQEAEPLLALQQERDELKQELAKAATAAAEREGALEQALEALRAAMAEKPVVPPPPEKPEKPAPPSSAPAGATEGKPPVEPVRPPEPAPPAVADPPKVEPPPAPVAAPNPPKPAPEPPKRAPRVPLRPEIDKKLLALLEQLRGEPAERKVATDALMELRRREPKVRDALRWFLEEEADPRVQARIKYIIQVAEFLPLWERGMGQGRLAASEAVANDALLVVGVWSAGFVALKSATGDQAWAQSDARAAIYSPALVGAHLVSVQTSSSRWTLHRTRLSDGVCERLDVQTARGQARLAGEGSLFVVAPEPGRIECRDVRTGAKRWEGETLSSYTSFTVGQGRAFYVERQRQIACRQLETSNVLWKSEAGMVSALGVGDDVVLGMDQAGDLVAIDLLGGRERWRAKVAAARGLTSLKTGAGCAVLWGGGTWISLDLETGKTLWSRSAATVTTRTGPAMVSGLLVVPESDAVVVIDARTGQEALRHEFARRQVTALASHGERLFVVLRDGVSAFTVR